MHTQQLSVTGMTCGHCVKHVTEELTKLAGVQDVKVDLVPEGTSTVHVDSDKILEMAALRDAISEAGYELKE